MGRACPHGKRARLKKSQTHPLIFEGRIWLYGWVTVFFGAAEGRRFFLPWIACFCGYGADDAHVRAPLVCTLSGRTMAFTSNRTATHGLCGRSCVSGRYCHAKFCYSFAAPLGYHQLRIITSWLEIGKLQIQ